MQAPQAPGIARSLNSAARPMASTEASGASVCIETSSMIPALPMPSTPTQRRVRAMLPKNRSSRAETMPAARQPMPPKNNGTQASSARCMSVSVVNSSFK